MSPLALLRRLFGLSRRDAFRRALRTYPPPPFNPPPMSPDDPGVRQPLSRGPRPYRPSSAVALVEPDNGDSQVATAIANHK